MKILVTGGAGYIGSHICKALRQSGHDPVVFDNLVAGHADFVKWGDFEKADLLDKAALDAAFKRHSPGAVMHFAAHALVGESVENPSKYYRNNVTGSLNLLEAARSAGVKRFVFSSTCATYGAPEAMPIPEEHPQRPINPYGETKLIIEWMLKAFDRAYGIKSVSLRYFNAAGADPQAEVGEDHDPETHLIPLILDAVIGRRNQVTVYGDDYPTDDGTCVRDYIHVADLADAHVRALEYLLNGGQTAAFNLGNGRGYSVKEVCDAARQVTGRDFSAVVGARRPGDPPGLVGSCGKAREILGWDPKRGEIKTIIRDAWNWHQKRFAKK